MPTVTVRRDLLFQSLGQTFTDSQFEDLCFEFGIELDDVTTEKEINSKQGQQAETLSDDIVYKIEVPANRYDLLCLEGLSLALRVFLEKTSVPHFRVKPSSPQFYIEQHDATRAVRPYVVAAILRNITFTDAVYKSFIDLQDKLHQNIGRRRTLVAIGTHDLDTIQAPFTYEAHPQKEIRFVPLNEEKEFAVDDLFQYYKDKNSHLAPYLPITASAPVHPVIYDANRTVLSLPPIINGEHSKITLRTKNVLIECTGTDLTKLHVVLQTVVAMFSGYCNPPYECEAVQIRNLTGGPTSDASAVQTINTPIFSTPIYSASVDYINKGIGIKMLPRDMITLLKRMSLDATYEEHSGELQVRAPITRTDILHACDIMEDVAIAYGYNKIVKTVPKTAVVARQQTINKLSDLVRECIAQAGWSEVLTWALVSHNDNYLFMNKSEEDEARLRSERCVKIGNPKTAEFEIVRTSILPGLLKALSSNQGVVNLPIRLFEVSDVALQCDTTDVGSKNVRRIGALYCGVTSGFEMIHGLVDRIMLMNRCYPAPWVREQKREYEKRKAAFLQQQQKQQGKSGAAGAGAAVAFDEDEIVYAESQQFTIRPSENPSFFPGRRADVLLSNGRCIGSFGVLHPTVLQHFDLPYPCSALELDLEAFL